MKAWRFFVARGLAAVLIGLASLNLAAAGQQHPAVQPAAPNQAAGDAAETAPDEAVPPDENLPAAQVDALVRDLGSSQFATRQQATRQLLELGIRTQKALERAAGDADAEVRARARRILAEVYQKDFEDRLEAFLADYDGSHGTLPAWEPFAETYGNSRMVRELFVEMQRAEPDLLEALAEGPKPAATALADRCKQILEGQGETLGSLGTLAALLFVGSTDEVSVGEQAGLNLLPYVVQATYQRSNRTPLWTGALKKMAARWIAKDTNPATAHQNMIFATQMEMRDEALLLASRHLAADDVPVNSRQTAILLLGHFGDRAHLPLLESLLEDTTSCGTVPTDKPPHQMELQIRDVALAVLVHLTDQELESYGFLSARNYVPPILAIGPLAFGNPEARVQALEKWAQWRAEHPDS